MANLIIVNRDGIEAAVEGQPGRSVMELVRDSGFDELQALCGGCKSCATCHVYVDPQFTNRLTPLSEDEDDLLDSVGSRELTSRLACQIVFTQALDGMRVTLAPDD